MHVIKLLHKTLSHSVPSVHRQRLNALLAGVESLLQGSFLTVTALGRGLNSPARVKHNIKRMDRLLSNPHLQQERPALYQALCHDLCINNLRPLILVDWTDIVDRERLMLLRAALVVEGRAIPLYDCLTPLKKYNSTRTHQQFLKTLHALLPKNCQPIIITDAGFRGPWFNIVEQLGWDWVGRIRNCVNYRLLSCQKWRPTQKLYSRANRKVTYLGPAQLSSKRPYECHLYLYKKPPQGRKANRSIVHTVRHANNRYFKKQQQDPWLIATNLSPDTFTPKQMMRLYGTRMQIEEYFRDLKSDRFGFGLALTRSKDIDRLNTLLLIAALATLCLWWVGYYAKQQHWQYHFQANTVRDKTVLSIPFLALAVIQRTDYVLTMTELIETKKNFVLFINDCNTT